MNGKFVLQSASKAEELDWGSLRWICGPALTGARDVVVCEVLIQPGKGHNFHRHPRQEEVIYVVDGQMEQWLDGMKKILGPGDSVFIPRGTVHASFTVGSRPLRAMAILGPCVGEGGYELVDVSGEAPWSTLRT